MKKILALLGKRVKAATDICIYKPTPRVIKNS